MLNLFRDANSVRIHKFRSKYVYDDWENRGVTDTFRYIWFALEGFFQLASECFPTRKRYFRGPRIVRPLTHRDWTVS